MNLTNEQIGQRIKTVRTEKNVTQTQLAEMLGKSLRTIQSYESGESRIFINTIDDISHALGVKPSYLLGIEEPKCQINTLADVLAFFYELNKKNELHFDIEMQHEQCDDGNYVASIKFRATDPDGELNERLAFLLEQFAYERYWGEEYWHSPRRLTDWKDKQVAEYSDEKLTDKPLYTVDLSKYDLAELKHMSKEELKNLK